MSAANDASDDGRGRDQGLHRRGMTFLRQARALPPPGLTAAEVNRVERRLAERPAVTRRALLVPAAAALGVLLVAGGALAVVGGGDLSRVPIVGRVLGRITDRSVAPAPRPPRHPATPAVPAVPVPPLAPSAVSTPPALLEPAPEVAPAPSPPPSSVSAPTPARGRAQSLASRDVARVRPAHVVPPPAAPEPPPPAAAPTAAAPTSAIAAEGRSLGAALARRHRDRAAGAALAALDEHERRFPDGQLRLEARVLRAEILHAGGREREALALLDAVSLAGVPRARELRTVRGELRARAGRCADARADFAAVLAGAPADSLAGRAARALATCP